MCRIVIWVVVAGSLVGGWAAPAPAADEKPADIAFSDENVAAAIKRGVDFLLSKQEADGSWGQVGGHADQYPAGGSAMIAYALLESGLVRFNDPKMKKALDWLEKSPAGKNCSKTYSLGLRANAWLAASKQGAPQYKENLRKDAKQLILSTKDGSYNYDSKGDQNSAGDNSNSQYGVLGVWGAAQADMEVPRKYWYMVMKHWLSCICGDGGWSYRKGMETTATMTTAGLASLFVCYDNLLAGGFVRCTESPEVRGTLAPLKRALDWMDEKFPETMKGSGGGLMGYGDLFYYLYGVERVGLASGYKYFGQTDWYKQGALKLLEAQKDDGSWQGKYGPGASTAYALLFLVRGRHAVLFNKLEFNSDWNNRPRDLAMLTRWTSDQFETTVNWQIINLRVPPTEWHDAPILYLSASKEPQFTDADIQAMRTFVQQGGTIFSCTECGGKGFSEGIRQAYGKMFATYKLTQCGRDHEIYTINFKLDEKTELFMISNGIRPLVIHTDADLPKAWQLRLVSTDKPAFETAVNVAMYVTDKALANRELVARGANRWPEEIAFQPDRTVTVARLQYKNNEGKAGNYDPEPLAWQRFGRMMAADNATRVNVAGPMPIVELAASGAKVAVLCGTDHVSLSQQEKHALQSFLDDSAGEVMDALLAKLEPESKTWPKAPAKPAAKPDPKDKSAKPAPPVDGVAARKAAAAKHLSAPATAERLKQLQGDLEKFELTLRFVGDAAKGLPNLLVSVPKPAGAGEATSLQVQITPNLARQVIGRLAEDGFLARSGKPAEPKGKAPAGPRYVLAVKSGGLDLTEDLGWGPEMLWRLQGLRQALGGGLLVLEAAGGSKGFAEAAHVAAGEILPDQRLRLLSAISPLFTQKGLEIREVRYRRWSKQGFGITSNTPDLKAMLDKKGRTQIIVSDLDLTAGLVGYSTYKLHGYQPDSAFQLMRNILLTQTSALYRPGE